MFRNSTILDAKHLCAIFVMTILASMPAYATTKTYLPNVYSSYYGWNSSIFVRNDHTAGQTVTFTLYNMDGSQRDQVTSGLIAKNGESTYDPAPANWHGSIVITSAGPISALVIHNQASPVVYAGYLGTASTSATSVFVPLVQRENGNNSSTLHIQNTSSGQTTVRRTFYPGGCDEDATIDGNGMLTLTMQDEPCFDVDETFFGTAKLDVLSGGPIVVTANQAVTSGSQTTQLAEALYNAAASTLYAPLVQHTSATDSGVAVQNANAYSRIVDFEYFKPNGSSCYTDATNVNVSAFYNRIDYPAPASANTCPSAAIGGKFTSTKNLSGTINQLGDNGEFSTYAAVASPSSTVSVPLWMRNHYGWTSGLQVMNTSSSTVNVTIKFYETDGTHVTGENITKSLDPNETYTVYDKPGTSPFFGTAVVSNGSGAGLAVAVNHILTGTGDRMVSHPGNHR